MPPLLQCSVRTGCAGQYQQSVNLGQNLNRLPTSLYVQGALGSTRSQLFQVETQLQQMRTQMRAAMQAAVEGSLEEDAYEGKMSTIKKVRQESRGGGEVGCEEDASGGEMLTNREVGGA